MNAQSRAIEDILRRENIPYKIVGGLKFYERKEIKDAIAYLRLIHNQADNLSLQRIINEPKRGIGDATLNAVYQISDLIGLPSFETITRCRRKVMEKHPDVKVPVNYSEETSFVMEFLIQGLQDNYFVDPNTLEMSRSFRFDYVETTKIFIQIYFFPKIFAAITTFFLAATSLIPSTTKSLAIIKMTQTARIVSITESFL